MRHFLQLIGCALAFAFGTNTFAVVVWSDDFSSANLDRDFSGGMAGADYTVTQRGTSSVSVRGLVGNSAPSLSFFDDGGHGSSARVGVTMNQFAPFIVGPLSATPILRVSFDIRIDAYSSESQPVPLDFLLYADGSPQAGRTLSIGFGWEFVNDGETIDPSDLSLFADTQTVNPRLNTSNAIGLILGVGWQPGFDFGGYNYFSEFSPTADTNDEFYNIMFDYDSTTGAVSGRVTRISTGESATLPSGLSLTPGTTFSSDNALQGFVIRGGSTVYTRSYFDNFIFEALVPEPSGTALLMGAFFMLFGGARRRPSRTTSRNSALQAQQRQ